MELNDIKRARERITGYVKRTPLEHSESLSKRLGTEVFVKYELFQKTGSFKPRGSFNKLLSLSDEERGRGVVAVSGGNHAQAVAYASATLGVDAIIVMPENTPQNYVDATRGYGAKLDLQPTIAASFAKIEEYTAMGRIFVHPFDDELVIAGQGTVGLEIMEDLPDVTDIITSIGGGGLAAGVAIAARSISPGARLWGVETEGADAMAQAIEAGQVVTLPAITSIAKTLGAPFVTERTLSLIQEHHESVTVVSDQDAVDELIFIGERLKVLVEPAASCTLAAAERLRNNFSSDSKLVLVFCGGNTTFEDVCGYIQGPRH